MTLDQPSRATPVIACDPNAVPIEHRDHWVDVGKQVYAAAQEVQELPHGYAFRLPTTAAMLVTITDYLAYERLCCAFLHFTLELEPSGGPVWLRLTGGAGVKAYLRSMFMTHPLLPEEVAQAGGLR